MEESNTPKTKKKLNAFWQTVISAGIAAAVLYAAFFISPGKAEDLSPEGYPISRSVFLLDTYCELTVYAGGGEEALNSAVERLNHYDDLFNKSKEASDIYRINHRSGDTVKIDPDTAEMLSAARKICEESGGRLEPAIGPVTVLWDFKDKKEVPDEEALKEALGKVKSLEWDVSDESFTAYDADVNIDIGAFAKGYVADKIKEDMFQNGVTSAIINLGGNELCLGSRPDGNPFRIAIREPDKDASEYSHILEIDDDSVVTAGIYERCFEKDGVLYHHILDPDTGYPVQNGLISVTVTGPESIICDALCTAIFVMGEEEGSRFLEEYNSEHGTGYEVIYLRSGED